MDKGREISSVIQDHVEWLLVFESAEGLFDAPVILLLSFTLPCIDRYTGGSDARLW